MDMKFNFFIQNVLDDWGVHKININSEGMKPRSSTSGLVFFRVENIGINQKVANVMTKELPNRKASIFLQMY